MKITKEITIEGADGMSNESLAQALREKADELERKEKVHEPEQGDVYSISDDQICLLTSADRNVVLKANYTVAGEHDCIMHKAFRNETYLGKFWDVMMLKSDHEKEVAELQAKHEKLVDAVVESVKVKDHVGNSIKDTCTGVGSHGIRNIRSILSSHGEPRIIKALGGGE